MSWLLNIALWLFGLIFKPKSAVDQARQSGALEVQKDEVQQTLKKVVQADAVRDAVARLPDGGLRDDTGNLYRD